MLRRLVLEDGQTLSLLSLEHALLLLLSNTLLWNLVNVQDFLIFASSIFIFIKIGP